MNGQLQMFGGDWTQQKLEVLKQYLHAYKQALKKQPFELYYIDAFAGTGYRETKEESDQQGLLFPDLAEDEPQQLLKGSTAMALEGSPPVSWVCVHRKVAIPFRRVANT